MVKYLIFGGTGFIGSHLTQGLLNDTSNKVYLVTRKKQHKSFWLLKKYDNFSFFQCDLKNKECVQALLFQLKPENIIFCAGENPSNETKPDIDFINGNIINSYNFLDSCLKYHDFIKQSKLDIKLKILNITSYEIFSGSDMSNLAIVPKTIYSATKASSFHLFKAWHHTYSLPIVTVVCSNNYGEHQGYDKFIPIIINNLLKNKPIKLFNNGKCKRNWIHVEDTAKAIQVVIENANSGDIYNVCSDDYVSNEKILGIIIHYFSKHTKTPESYLHSLVQYDKNEVKAYNHNSSYDKLQLHYNWAPRISLETGLKSTLKWFINKNI